MSEGLAVLLVAGVWGIVTIIGIASLNITDAIRSKK